MKYAIEKGLPIPQRKGRQKEYPIHELEVGDSFYVPDKNGTKPLSVTAYVSRFNKIYKGSKQFATSRLDPETNLQMPGTRVYRIK